MEILPYQPEMDHELAGVLTEGLQPVPHCYPVEADALRSALAVAAGEAAAEGRLGAERAFVTRENGELTGLSHVAVEAPREDDEAAQGIIRFLWHREGYRSSGEALLNAAEAHVREQGVTRVRAFAQDYIYPFYHLGHAYLSVRLGHVHGLLGMAGYTAVGGEVFLDWVDFGSVVPPRTGVAADISVKLKPGEGRLPGVTVLARDGDKDLGVCVSVSGGEFSGAEAAQAWIFTEWLGVKKTVRGNGLGAHLLCRAVQEAHLAGYRHAAISTSWRNWRALLLYSNYGYRVVDWTYCMQREM